MGCPWRRWRRWWGCRAWNSVRVRGKRTSAGRAPELRRGVLADRQGQAQVRASERRRSGFSTTRTKVVGSGKSFGGRDGVCCVFWIACPCPSYLSAVGQFLRLTKRLQARSTLYARPRAKTPRRPSSVLRGSSTTAVLPPTVSQRLAADFMWI